MLIVDTNPSNKPMRINYFTAMVILSKRFSERACFVTQSRGIIDKTFCEGSIFFLFLFLVFIFVFESFFFRDIVLSRSCYQKMFKIEIIRNTI